MRNVTSILVALLVLASGSIATAQEAAKPKPDVLFISIDDMNDWVGCLKGHPQIKTPHIDAVARRGTLFTNAHCQAAVCNPSRASVLTGLRPSSMGIYGLSPGFRAVPALKDVVTLPQHFAAHGYRTFTTGKIFHDGSIPPRNRAAEFQEWGTDGQFARPATKFVQTPQNHPLMDWGVFPKDGNDALHGDWKIADAAIAELKKPRDKPLFLAVGFRFPHVPCYATQKWFDLYPLDGLQMPPVLENDRDDVPPFAWYLHWKLPEPRLSWLKQSQQWKPLVQAYLASTSFMDSQIGRVIKALEETGKLDQTIIVIWSDHGWHLGEKGISGKNTLWERSTRVPLIFAGPGIAKNASCEQPAELLDLYPTLSELAGLPAREGLEGQSLLPQLKDASAVREQPAITTSNQGNHAVRSVRWRYIRYADGSQELYDMKADPNEWKNLAGDPAHAQVIRAHARWLPKIDLPPAVPGAPRVLVKVKDQWLWEGKPVIDSELEE